MPNNTRVLFNSIPVGAPKPSDFSVVTDPSFDVAAVDLPGGSIIVKVSWLSLDPYMRGRMRPAGTKSYSAPFELGKPFNGHAVGTVVRSASAKYVEGDIVLGMFSWSSYAIVNEAYVTRKLNAPDTPKLPAETWLGLLGMPSFTAYAGLVVLGKPKEGETLFVSAAAGAVGQVVGQMGKRLGLRVVGSCGSDAKVDHLVSNLGFDAAFNYNKHSIKDKLAELCPNGIDIYFENVGGETLDAVLPLMNVHGRIPVCGMISQYNATGTAYGITNLMQIISKRVTIQGFLVSDFYAEHHEAFLQWMFAHGLDDKFVYEQTVAEGFDSVPAAFIGMMEGKNVGKQLVKVE